MTQIWVWHPAQVVQIKDARFADARGIAGVQVASWRVAYRGLLPAKMLDGLSEGSSEQTWADRLSQPEPRRAVVVAAQDGAVIGFAAAGANLDADAGDETGQLYAIYVHPNSWRKGVGRELHDSTLDRLHGYGFTEAVLWVLDGNERAAAFYRWAGWRADGATQLEHGPSGVELAVHRLRYDLAR